MMLEEERSRGALVQHSASRQPPPPALDNNRFDPSLYYHLSRCQGASVPLVPFQPPLCAAASTCTNCSQPRLSLLRLMMLCSLCSSIVFEAGAHVYEPGSTNFPKHHSSFTDLETSANSGCQLCQILFRNGATPMESGGRTHQGDDLHQIYYRTHTSTFLTKYPLGRGVTEIQFFLKGETVGPFERGGWVAR
ncbi:uncharacterized protein K444DRAFT_100166 [Hyaloscypha bicolor E]|uniref:Uncharacterized protein n=1 Tax=Hyaloscypha bicolor E TaxID=1095630 RepID=A0A2J6SWZ4_9HELO|nr:uncharacterized protein K444DRAFT_100166 [Hyaloscypha bicolor E]PMD55183.1 hypothetical protein K444DRAFT_100166 [Hyaloscypha bicolor E]